MSGEIDPEFAYIAAHDKPPTGFQLVQAFRNGETAERDRLLKSLWDFHGQLLAEASNLGAMNGDRRRSSVLWEKAGHLAALLNELAESSV